jgi:hypothetical protein
VATVVKGTRELTVMSNGYATVKKTPEGKYYGQVRRVADGVTITYYETPEYLTPGMAGADANCWRLFRMTAQTHTTCGTCKKVTPNNGPWNISVTWCNKCVEAGEHLPKPAKAEYVVEEGDTVTSDKTRNGIPRNTYTGNEFADFISRTVAKFPETMFSVGQEYGGRRMPGDDFFLTIKRFEGSREQTFRVHKAGKGKCIYVNGCDTTPRSHPDCARHA